MPTRVVKTYYSEKFELFKYGDTIAKILANLLVLTTKIASGYKIGRPVLSMNSYLHSFDTKSNPESFNVSIYKEHTEEYEAYVVPYREWMDDLSYNSGLIMGGIIINDFNMIKQVKAYVEHKDSEYKRWKNMTVFKPKFKTYTQMAVYPPRSIPREQYPGQPERDRTQHTRGFRRG